MNMNITVRWCDITIGTEFTSPKVFEGKRARKMSASLAALLDENGFPYHNKPSAIAEVKPGTLVSDIDKDDCV